MCSCAPLKSSAHSPTSSHSPTTIPPTPKRPRGDAPHKNRYTCTPNTHLHNPQKQLETPTNRETYSDNKRLEPLKVYIYHKQKCASRKLSRIKLCHADRPKQ